MMSPYKSSLTDLRDLYRCGPKVQPFRVLGLKVELGMWNVECGNKNPDPNF